MGTLTHKFNKKLVKDTPGQFSFCVRYTTNQEAEGEYLRHCTKESVMARCGEEGALIDCQRKKNQYYYITREEVQVRARKRELNRNRSLKSERNLQLN